MATTQKDTKVITGDVRLVFPELFTPKAFEEGDDPTYSVRILISKSDVKTVKAIERAKKAALAQGKEKLFSGKLPRNFQEKELIDGDVYNQELIDDGEEPRPELEGHYFMNVNAKSAPGVVKPVGKDENGKTKFDPITDESEIYSGVYARVSMNWYCYDGKKSKGVTAGLNNVVKIMDGDYLGGRSSAASDFADEDFDIGDLDDDEDLI